MSPTPHNAKPNIPHGALPDGQRPTEMGNAHRLARQAGDRIRYCHDTDRWHVYADGVWIPDPKRIRVDAEGRAVVEGLWDLAATEPDPDRYKFIKGFAERSSKAGALAAMIRIARTLPELQIDAAGFDRHPHHVCVANGVVDLTTGDLLPHGPEWLFTRQVPVAYDPTATAPGFAAFLAQVQPDPATRDYLSQALGLGLVGANPGHHVHVFYGSGANGKGVLTSIVRDVLGEQVAHTGDEKLLFSTDQHPTGMAALAGKRLVVCSEGERGRSWAEARLKKLSGDTRLTARYIAQDFFTFDIGFSIILETNHLPEVRGTDDGIWRRLRVVPFNVTIDERDRDDTLESRLVATEAEGILAWLVKGAGRLLAHGLPEVPEVASATEGYRANATGIAAFLADRCGDPGSGDVGSTELYGAYQHWCGLHGCDAMTQRALADRLKPAGYANRKDGLGRMRWDLRLR